MHPQLQQIVDELDAATARFHQLADRTANDEWGMRPAPGKWSVSECVAHLNLSAEAFVPRLREAMQGLPKDVGTRRMRRSPFGWMLWRIMPPPVRFSRAPTISAMVPGGELDRETLTADFLRWQEEQLRLVHEADGSAIDRVRIRSPFSARVTYDVFSALSILPLHEHRHLWQAEQAVDQLRTSSRAG
jgi:hypothetical protein